MYLIFDGGNGGHRVNKGYGSFHVYTDPTMQKIILGGSFSWLQPMTSNEAEYNTLLGALQQISDTIDDPESVYGALIIEGDSELVRNQVLGNWQIKKNHLRPLRDQIVSLLGLWTNWQYRHIPREKVVSVLGH